LINPDDTGGVSFSTHRLPLFMLVTYLKAFITDCQILVIGIQPKTLDFGCSVCRQVKKSVKDVSDTINAVLKGQTELK